MFNLLKSDIYRLVHGKMLWVSLTMLAVLVAGAVGLLWFATTPTFAQMVNDQAAANAEEAGSASSSDAGLKIAASNGADLAPDEVASLNEKTMDSRTYSYAQILVASTAIGILSSLIAALYLASDFDTGYAKNVFAGRTRRASYYAEKLVLCGILCAVFLLAGMFLCDAAFALSGFSVRRVESFGEYWAWAGLAWLACMVYVTATAVVVWLARSKTAGVVFAILVASGLFASILMTVAQALSPAIPLLGELAKWLPANGMKLLMSGGAGLLSSTEGTALAGLTVPAQIGMVSTVAVAACAVLSQTLCKRKDV